MSGVIYRSCELNFTSLIFVLYYDKLDKIISF